VDVVIITGDKDILQLVRPSDSRSMTHERETVWVEEVIERFGVSPEQVVEVMVYPGIAIDNIRGFLELGKKQPSN